MSKKNAMVIKCGSTLIPDEEGKSNDKAFIEYLKSVTGRDIVAIPKGDLLGVLRGVIPPG